MGRKRKSRNPAGRPVSVGGESAAVVLSVRIPAALRERAQLSAEAQGLTASEWWRRAAEACLSVKGRVDRLT